MPNIAAVILAPPLALSQTPVDVAPLESVASLPAISASMAEVSWSLDAGQETAQDNSASTSQPLPQDAETAAEVAADAAQTVASEPQETQQAEDDDAIIVTGEYGPPNNAVEVVSQASFAVTEGVDKAIVGPVADAYEEGVPSPIRNGLRNFLRNLREPTNFMNFLLQGKVGKAFETAGRFAINSTFGLGGLIDVAGNDTINLPYRRNSFSNTLGFYGVGHGGYMVLPLVGATTVRDFIGSGLDQSIVPFIIGKPFNTPEYGIPAYVINSLQFRIDFDDTLRGIRQSGDAYGSLKEEYLGRREEEVQAFKDGDPNMGIPESYVSPFATPEPADEAEADAGAIGAGEAGSPQAGIQAVSGRAHIAPDVAVLSAFAPVVTEHGKQATRPCTLEQSCTANFSYVFAPRRLARASTGSLRREFR